MEDITQLGECQAQGLRARPLDSAHRGLILPLSTMESHEGLSNVTVDPASDLVTTTEETVQAVRKVRVQSPPPLAGLSLMQGTP